MLLGFGNEAWIIPGLVIAGLMFDAFMAIHQAAVLDLKGVGVFAGSALGLLVMYREIGGVFSPPIGNWLAQYGEAVPFFFWGGMGLLAAVAFIFLPKRAN